MDQFSDIKRKIKEATEISRMKDSNGMPMFPDAVKHVINTHGKFYGLRSKYDGRGNLRKPFKA